ncbi:hypothetical protein [Streptomyces sp. Qhu_M48]|uniref:hypothetical protein n=1 Tax=Streptomyces sp. Qhu_M48 TaxID=3435889 RepID=UPI003F4FAB34
MTAFQDSDGRPESKPTQSDQTAQGKAGDTAAVLGDQATHVAQNAKEQAGHVVDETQSKAKDIVGDLRAELQDQASTQTQRLADNVRKLAGEIRDLSENGESNTTAAGLARQMADRGQQMADHLEDRGPDGLISDLQDFARRRPGMFLVGAALAGFAVARAGKGVGAATSSGTQAPAGAQETAHRPAVADDPLPSSQGRDGVTAPAEPADTYGQSQPPHVTHVPSVSPAPPASPAPAQPYSVGRRPGEGS